MSTKIRFEKEAKCNSEMAYCNGMPSYLFENVFGKPCVVIIFQHGGENNNISGVKVKQSGCVGEN